MIKGIGLIFIIIFLVSMQISFTSPSNNSENAQNLLKYPLVSSYNPVAFSYFFNSSNNILNLFTTQIDNNNVTLTHFRFTSNYPGTYSNYFPKVFNITNWNNTISSFTYFNTSQHSFYIVKGSIDGSQNKSIYLFVDNLNVSNSFHLTIDYNLLSVHQFFGSNDVYFTFYNASVILILRYSNNTNHFNIFYDSYNLNINNYSIQKADAFTYENQLYIMYYYGNLTTRTFNSTVLIFHNAFNYPVFNKTFIQRSFTSIFPFNEGLLLYSMSTGYFYRYQYNTNTIVSQLFYTWNFSSIRPFDSNSFLTIDNNSLSVYNFIDNSNTGIDLVREYQYNIDNTNYPSNRNTIQAFAINSSRYYLLNLWYKNRYCLTLESSNRDPINGNINPSYTSNLPYSYTSMQSQYTYTSSSSSSSFAVIFIIIFILIVVGAFFAFEMKNKKRDRYYLPRDDSYLNNYNTGRTKSERTVNVKNFCYSCNAMIEKGDIFCQNCGNRLH